LRLEQKLAVKQNENNIGYLPINASVQGVSTVHKATKPNQNESFFVSHDRGPEHPDVLAGKTLRGRNQWPSSLPGIRADMMAYFEALGAMYERMLSPFAAARGLPGDFFAPFFADEARHGAARNLWSLDGAPAPGTEEILAN
jgi:isopenicillin N synthase-like dioxygenase